MKWHLPVEWFFMIAFACPCGCGNTYRVPEPVLNQTFRCPVSSQPVQLPTRTQLCDEQSWLQGSHPSAMLRYVSHHATPRKFRLATVACCCLLSGQMDEPAVRAALETMEALADGAATPDEVASAVREARKQLGAEAALRWPANLTETMVRLLLLADPREMASMACYYVTQMACNTREEARQAVADVLQELFGNPFRPLEMDASTRRWHEETPLRIARLIYDDRQFDDLPILADALEDAGCQSSSLLSHLRRPGPHRRGCWALDLVLGLR